ncbi:hypothetical protein VNO77_19527 [Canavalia gladiata]|uniref:Uncharacterized protein n=1 Tax=Canavalia gladiata TaxID=3824 RepID=A0AAN9LRG9_CANGL
MHEKKLSMANWSGHVLGGENKFTNTEQESIMQSSQLITNDSCSAITPQPFTKKRMCSPSPLTDISNSKHLLVPFARSVQKTIPLPLNQTDIDSTIMTDVNSTPGDVVSNDEDVGPFI